MTLEVRQECGVDEFVDVVRRDDPRLRALARRLVGAADVDDVLQGAYIKAFRSFGSFRAEAAMSTWLYRIVYTTSLDHLRGRARRSGAERRATNEPVPIDVIAYVDDRIDVERGLARLQPADTAVLVLVDAHGLSYADAAAVLGCPEGTVGSRLSRARQALRAVLGEGRQR